MPQLGHARNGWHPGELVVQQKMGFGDSEALATMWHEIEDHMTDQLRLFFSKEIPFLPLATLDDSGRPWSAIIAGRGGAVGGYGESPRPQQLLVNTRSWDGDPLLDTVAAWEKANGGERDPRRFLVAGVGVQWWSRRRNKIAGRIRSAKKDGYELELDLEVNQGVGNCPKYINVRDYEPYPDTKPTVAHRVPNMAPTDVLPPDVIDFIQSADAVFVSSVYKARPEDAELYPSHAGMNHRGGLPGFLRVRPSDSRTVVLPDFSGDRFMSSLGNIEITGLAGLTMVSSTTGDILYLTGKAENLFGEKALLLMPRQAALTTITTTGYVFVRDALPVRQKEGTEVKRSPYTPPIKHLREEGKETSFGPGEAPTARLARIEIHADDIGTFDFEIDAKDQPVVIRPGQAIALGFSRVVERPAWSHMAPKAPTSLNDDRVRTWTVSSAHENGKAQRFRLTMREKFQGVVTGALFAIARRLRDQEPEKLHDTRSLNIDVGVVGVAGEFYLPPRGTVARIICAAGGIGVTPFQSMLAALTERGPETEADVVIALTTREPDVFIALLREALGPSPPPGIHVRLDVFTHVDPPVPDPTETTAESNFVEIWHKGRIPHSYWAEVAEDRVAFICGPGGFGDAVSDGLRDAGLPVDKIHREGFDY